MKINEQLARCFGTLRAPELAPYLEYLKAEKQEALELMAQVVDLDKIYRLQGRVASLGELIQLIEGAEALIAKMKR